MVAITKERLENIRKHPISEADQKRDAGLTTPEDIQRFDNIVYTDIERPWPEWNLLDVYRPKNCEGKLPVIISVHGGGWVGGIKEVYQWYCMKLAQHGFAVVNFNYRLAPECPFPANEEDVNEVVKWVLAHGEEYGFDLNNIFAVGDSAGGHILAVYANITSNPDYAAKMPFEVPEGFKFNAIALNSAALSENWPVTCTVDRFKEISVEEQWSSLMGGVKTMEEIHILDVPSYVTSAYPPTFMMTCVADFLVNEPMKLCRALMEHKVPFNYHFFGTPEEPLHHVFHCDIRNPQATVCNDEECEFFRTYIR